MSFFDIIKKYETLDLKKTLSLISPEQASLALSKEVLDDYDFLSLLSPAAFSLIENMAERARTLTLQNFGKTIQLYTPLYVSDFCDNGCLYCGYSTSVNTTRKKLSLPDVEREAGCIASTGIRHVLLLTGGSRGMSPVSYIKDCVGVLKKYFQSIGIEVYPLSEEEYKELIIAGVDSLTVYQETYNRKTYSKVHPAGPKGDYLFRLGAPERALKQDIRGVNIGALLGLDDCRIDGFFTGLHANYLQQAYPAAEISVSVPRIKQTGTGYVPDFIVKDREIVQLVLALRIFLPRAGINLSTRESSGFRDNMLALGITKISAQSVTSVGGHAGDKSTDSHLEQFSISDKRGVKEVLISLKEKGLQPVFKDWMHI